ncbi:MAG: hypothetical protein ACTSSE_03220 [Candidatus Thorarchaeota archaeon]
MAAKDDNPAIKEISEKVDNLAKELADLRKELSPVAKLDKKLDGLATTKGADAANKKMDELAAALKGFEGDIQAIKDAKETEVIIKKIDDILLSMIDIEVLGKKLDDLQGYVAGLSGIEEKVEDLTNQFTETKEIVGIIVRQLDDIERKFNQSIDKISETAEIVVKIAESSVKPDSAAKDAGKKAPKTTETKEAPEEKKPPVSKAKLPSTIDAIMSRLIDIVNPQTEAAFMAESLEDARDELTPMITVHTPVLFQFGKKARELKSYPPTATLNENDIASLNKEIKSWASKLKEIAKSS